MSEALGCRLGLTAVGLPLLTLLLASLPVEGQGTGATALDECDVLVQDAPDDHRSYLCYLQVARRARQPGEASRRLERLLERD